MASPSMLTADYLGGGGFRVWRPTNEGVITETNEEYRPTLYLGGCVSNLYGRRGGPNPTVDSTQETLEEDLLDLRAWLATHEAVASTAVEFCRQSWRTGNGRY